jgi:hypothetical protein
MSTSVYKNNKYLDLIKRDKYFKDLVKYKIISLKIIPQNIKRKKPEVNSTKTEWTRNYLLKK